MTPPPPPVPRRVAWLRSASAWAGALSGLFLVAVAMRCVGRAPGEGLWGLDAYSLWYDEAFGCLLARRPWGEMLRVAALDVHPPLYYAFLKIWLPLGGADAGAAWARWLSVLLGALCAPATAELGRQMLSKRTGLLAGALMTVAPYHIYYSHEIRMYALGCLIHIAALAALWRVIRRPTPAATALYCGAAVLTLYTHYYFLFVLVGHFGCLIATARLRGECWVRALRRGLTIALGILILYLPWFYTFLAHSLNNTGQGVHAFAGGATWADAINYLFEWPLGFRQVVFFADPADPARVMRGAMAVGVSLYGLMAWGLWSLWRERRTDAFWLAVGGLVAPMILTALYVMGPGRFFSRCWIFLFPMAFLLIAQGVWSLRRPLYAGLVIAWLAATLIPSAWAYVSRGDIRDTHGPAWRRFVQFETEPPIFCSQPFDYLPMACYDRPRERVYLLNSDRKDLIQEALMGRDRTIFDREQLTAMVEKSKTTPDAPGRLLLVISDWNFNPEESLEADRRKRIAQIETHWLAGRYRRVEEALFHPLTPKWVYVALYEEKITTEQPTRQK